MTENVVVDQQGNDGCLRELALFAGVGGGILGGTLLGWQTVCAVERDAYAATILAQRQTDGILPIFPIWSDVTTFDGRPWRGIIDVVSGGFPCQDISAAGKGAGITGSRSGLWTQMARIIGEVRPRFVFVENSPILTSRGLNRVLGDLAAMGFNARWGVISAADVGAPHLRARIWIVANANGVRELQLQGCKQNKRRRVSDSGLCNSYRAGLQERKFFSRNKNKTQSENTGKTIERADWWAVEPDVGRMVDGLAFRMDRLKSIGNGQVPRVAATAWQTLKK